MNREDLGVIVEIGEDAKKPVRTSQFPVCNRGRRSRSIVSSLSRRLKNSDSSAESPLILGAVERAFAEIVGAEHRTDQDRGRTVDRFLVRPLNDVFQRS